MKSDLQKEKMYIYITTKKSEYTLIWNCEEVLWQHKICVFYLFIFFQNITGMLNSDFSKKIKIAHFNKEVRYVYASLKWLVTFSNTSF